MDKLHYHDFPHFKNHDDVKNMSVLTQSNATDHLDYCSSSFTPVWRSHGLSPCFYAVVTDAVLLLLVFPLMMHIRTMLKKAIQVEAKYKPISLFFQFQYLCSILMFLEVPVEFIVQWSAVDHKTSGISIQTTIFRFIFFGLLLWLVTLERNMMLLSARIRGHSNTMVMMWGVVSMIDVASTVSWNSMEWWFGRSNYNEKVLFGFWLFRVITSLVLLLLSMASPGVPKLNYCLHINIDPDRDVENGLLAGPSTTSSSTNQTSQDNASTWKGLKRKLILLIPYIWPAKSLALQFRVLLCVVILVAGRVVNLFVPIYYKHIVDELTNGTGTWTSIVELILVFTGLRLLQGSFSSGLLNNMRSYLWIRVQQYTNKHVQLRLFEHLHSLSLRWHLARKTGEVLRSVDRGTSSINSLLSYIVFSILPTFFDIAIAITYFISAFNPWFGLIVFICLTIYLVLTIVITEWRTKFRREMNTKDNAAKQKAIDSLLNFETVKYYNGEEYEVNRFGDSIDEYQNAEYKSVSSLVFLNVSQSVTINLGLLAGSLLSAKFVLDGTFQVGDFVLFGTYILQLYTPLGYFGTYYRMIQSSFIDMENMFQLFDEEKEVRDVDDALTFNLDAGKVEFKDVCFHYAPERPILKNISFTVNAGETYALVGQSGSGKSTIVRLLFRFYDVQSGYISIDGTDISTVTQKSLRAKIGVVPQDTVLFNDSIMNNIKYGKTTATEEEAISAAKSADIHDRIANMPDQYATQVGERGLKLSGGEKQRVAIARTILKAPDIIMLDEATSALDTMTERNIQSSLSRVCAGKTSIVVAHRLSTIINADCILVLRDGEIVERGSHDDLLKNGGVYKEMWNQQLSDITGDTTTEENEKDSDTDDEPSSTSKGGCPAHH